MRQTLALATLLSVAAPAVADVVETRGDAFAIGTDAVLYTEQHLLRRDGDTARERIVLYRCPDGRAFGRKTLDYGDTPATPTFRMDDANVGYVEGARRDGDVLVAFAGFTDAGEPQAWPIPASPSLVIDAGFDEFIRSHWEKLQAGESLPIRFVVPNRGKAYDFRLVKLREETIADTPSTVLRLSLGGVLGWFASDIDVSYRNSDQRLMRFEGLTSVRADRNDNVSARIEFPLDAEHVLPDDDAAWQAALDEPLVQCGPAA